MYGSLYNDVIMIVKFVSGVLEVLELYGFV